MKIEHFIMALLLAAALSISACASACAPKPEPGDTDPRVADEERSYNIFTDNIFSSKFLSFFCTKRY